MGLRRKLDRTKAALEAVRLYNRGNGLLEEGLLEEAERAFRRSLEFDPSLGDAWFNLSLVYKRLRRWEECLRCTEKVVELDPSEHGAWWNMGIAATALRDWRAARRGWRAHEIRIPDGDGPIEGRFGMTPIRLNPEGDGEVVWCDRVDPARAIVRSIPLPESGHRWGDYVLHDGEPRGERVAYGRTYAVFDELERWQPSDTPTLRVQVVAESLEASHRLVDLFDEHGLAAEDWTGNVRRLCQSCSQGSPHEHHERQPGDWHPERDFGLAAHPEAADALLRGWAADGVGRWYGPIEVVA